MVHIVTVHTQINADAVDATINIAVATGIVMAKLVILNIVLAKDVMRLAAKFVMMHSHKHKVKHVVKDAQSISHVTTTDKGSTDIVMSAMKDMNTESIDNPPSNNPLKRMYHLQCKQHQHLFNIKHQQHLNLHSYPL